MTPFAHSVQQTEADLHLLPLASVTHRARGSLFELYVCRLNGSGQYRVYVAKNGESCGYTFDPAHATSGASEAAIIEDLIGTAKSDVEGNFQGAY